MFVTGGEYIVARASICSSSRGSCYSLTTLLIENANAFLSKRLCQMWAWRRGLGQLMTVLTMFSTAFSHLLFYCEVSRALAYHHRNVIVRGLWRGKEK